VLLLFAARSPSLPPIPTPPLTARALWLRAAEHSSSLLPISAPSMTRARRAKAEGARISAWEPETAAQRRQRLWKRAA